MLLVLQDDTSSEPSGNGNFEREPSKQKDACHLKQKQGLVHEHCGWVVGNKEHLSTDRSASKRQFPGGREGALSGLEAITAGKPSPFMTGRPFHREKITT